MYLGIDYGSARMKWATVEGDTVRWGAKALAVTRNRQKDFKDRLYSIFSEVGTSDAEAIIISTSNEYAFPTFREALEFNISCIDALLEGVPVYFTTATGELVPVGEAHTRDAFEFGGTKHWGSVYLGSKTIENGLVVDMGTTSMEVTPIVGGKIDPAGWGPARDYNLYRWKARQLVWYGSHFTPLEYLTREVRGHQVAPRGARMVNVIALLEKQDVTLGKAHGYFEQFPTPEEAYVMIAKSVGLDTDIIGRDEAVEIAKEYYDTFIQQVGDVIAAVGAKNHPAFPDVDFHVSGLSRDAILIPAIERLGAPRERIKTHPLMANDGAWSAATAVGAAAHGQEAFGA